MTTTIRTDRLLIRNFHAGDVRDLYDMIAEYQSSEYAEFDHEWPTTLNGIQSVVDWFAAGDDYLAVCLADGGDFIGFVALAPTMKGERGERSLGYCFRSQSWGHGYATEACAAVLEYAFNTLGVERFKTSTAALNKPSMKLLDRLGMKRTGESMVALRKDENGQPIEFPGISFELSRSQWTKMNQKVR